VRPAELSHAQAHGPSEARPGGAQLGGDGVRSREQMWRSLIPLCSSLLSKQFRGFIEFT
jgi:hypothetical protein